MTGSSSSRDWKSSRASSSHFPIAVPPAGCNLASAPLAASLVCAPAIAKVPSFGYAGRARQLPATTAKMPRACARVSCAEAGLCPAGGSVAFAAG